MNDFFDISYLRKGYFRVFILVFLFLLSGLRLYAQTEGSLCALLQVGQAAGNVGDTVWVEVKILGPDSLAGTQFAIDWDTSMLQLVGRENLITIPYGDFSPFAASVEKGSMRYTWVSASGYGIPFGNEIEVYKAGFLVKSATVPFIPIHLTNNGTFEVEIFGADKFYPSNSQDGGIVVGQAPADVLQVTGICSTPRLGCLGVLGMIDISVAGGLPPYLYSWEGPDGFASNAEDLSGLVGGKYHYVVTDQNGLSVDGIVEIAPNHVQIDYSVAITPVSSCSGQNGAISITVDEYYAPYNIEWDAPDLSGAEVHNLLPGEYSFTITAANGCSMASTENVNLEQQDAFTVHIPQIFEPNCGLSNGYALLFVWFNYPPFTALWSDGGTGMTRNDLSAGTYSVTVTNAVGCTGSTQFKMSSRHTSDWLFTPSSECNPETQESVFLAKFSAGSNIDPTFPLQLDWGNGIVHTLESADGFATDSLFGSAPGIYNLTITDAAGCVSYRDFYYYSYCTPILEYENDICLGMMIDNVHAQVGDTIIVPIRVQNFVALDYFASNIYWDTSILKFCYFIPGAIWPDYYSYGAVTDLFTDFWATDQYGMTLADSTVLFSLSFVVHAGISGDISTVISGLSESEYGAFFYAGATVYNGTITLGNAAAPPFTSSICYKPSTCSSDGLVDINLNVSGGNPPYLVSWYSDVVDTIQQGGLQDLALLPEASTYYITITDQDGQQASYSVTNVSTTYPEMCLWPGDADHNRSANHFDLLYIGYAYGATGYARYRSGTAWLGVPFISWDTDMPNSETNTANMDTNGDGRVNAADTLAITQNWGYVIRPGTDDPLAMPAFAPPAGDSTDVPLFPRSMGNTPPHPGDWIEIAYHLGDAEHRVDSLSGIAFSIGYSPDAFEPGTVRFSPTTDSWFGNPDSSEILFLQKNIESEGRLDLAISRKASYAGGFGKIGVLRAKIKENLFSTHSDDTEMMYFYDSIILTDLRLSHIFALSAQETRIGAMGMDTVLSIVKQIQSGTNGLNESIPVSVSPNPAHASARIISQQAGIESVTILDNNGHVVRALRLPAPLSCEISTGDLVPGLYWLKIGTSKGVVWQKMGKM